MYETEIRGRDNVGVGVENPEGTHERKARSRHGMITYRCLKSNTRDVRRVENRSVLADNSALQLCDMSRS